MGKNRYNYKGATLSLLFIIPIGLYTKFYSGLSSDWINHSIGGVFYEIFWCILFSTFFTNISPIRICLFVLGFTCILEFLQLSDFSFLQFVRSYFIGRILIGTSFSWTDFLYYFIGSGIGWLWVKQLRASLSNNKL